jgi:hypothetical protein
MLTIWYRLYCRADGCHKARAALAKTRDSRKFVMQLGLLLTWQEDIRPIGRIPGFPCMRGAVGL